MHNLDEFVKTPRIAYFTMEVALHSDIHTYSGGLGVLAGDTARSAADLEIPLVVVTLLSKQGYLRQEIDFTGQQSEQPDPWHPNVWATPLGAKIGVMSEDREVWVRPWLYRLRGISGYDVPVLLLDTDLHENDEKDRALTDSLYGGDQRYRLKQEIVLGIGGVRILRALGFEIHTYHLNEGHSALLALELMRQYQHQPALIRPGEGSYDVARVRERCIFTTHTPVESGHDQFPYSLVERVLNDYIDMQELKLLAGDDVLNMTRLALNLSGYINGVARRHAEVARQKFPQYRVHAITNGVHPQNWTSPPFAHLYEKYIPEWLHEPSELIRADLIDDEEIWSAHQEAKRELIDKVHLMTDIDLDLNVCLFGFARRMTGYKRPDLLFHDLERLIGIHKQFPIQLVFAGKAHPNDEHGNYLIRLLHQHIRELGDQLRIAYIPNYDMDMARHLISGTDVWLNTPMPPQEASGTSGMKAAFNGVLHLSILDGWWVEGCIDGITGWEIDGEAAGATDADNLYRKLQTAVLPLYYQDRTGWIKMMKSTISKNTRFNSHRMMRRYASEAYIR